VSDNYLNNYQKGSLGFPVISRVFTHEHFQVDSHLRDAPTSSQERIEELEWQFQPQLPHLDGVGSDE